MKKKLLLVLLSATCIAGTAFGAAGCNIGSGGDEHTHTFETKWSYDDEFHWHAATCGHASEKGNKSAHVIADGACTVCEFEDDSAPKTYKTVTFNLNGGEGKLDKMQFVVGKVMSDLPVPKRNGYNFICWEEAFGDEFTAASVMPDRDLTLVAKWEKVLTKYSDKFVSFKPATEGCKNNLLQFQYDGEVDKFVYVEITSDDLGGVDKVGQSNNFNLRSMDGMEYKVNAGYTWAWYQGSFEVPNGAQRFTLNYGSNVQFVTITDGDGVVQQTYLVDLYVMHDYYVSLYDNVYETEPYERVRVKENDRFPESHETPTGKFEADKRVYKNTETGKFENFVYSTAITKNWNLYQTYKPYAIETELNGGTVEGNVEITPYTEGYTLPVPVKEGYDFIGWKNASGKYLTNANGYGGEKYLAEKTEKSKPAAINLSDKLTAHFEVSNKFYATDCDCVVSFNAIRKLTYADKYETAISKTTFSVEANGQKVPDNLKRVAIGDEVTVTAGKLGHTFIGWYDGETKLSEEAEYKFAMPLKNIGYTAEYEAAAELAPFTFTATADTLVITGLKDKTTTEIVVPSCATAIGANAFLYCTDLESVIIENGVTTIGWRAFYDCSSLKNIVIPDSVTELGMDEVTGDSEDLFYKCSIETATVPSAACGLLRGYRALKSVTVTSGKVIADGAFEGCVFLTNVTLHQTLTGIGSNAFKGCTNLNKITIPDSVTKIGESAFEDCSSLSEIKLPENLKTIGKATFKNCSALTEITLPDGLTTIGNSAFYGCGITELTIPDSTESLYQDTFAGCGKLESLTIPFVRSRTANSTNTYQYPFGYLFGKTKYEGGVCTRQLFYGYSLKETEYADYYIPASLKSVTVTGGNILPYAFHNCANITDITLGNEVLSVGFRAFYGCGNLTDLTIGSGITFIDPQSTDQCPNFSKVHISDMSAWLKIDYGYYIANPLYNAHNLYLNGELVTELVIPEDVTVIKEGAFIGCQSITSIDLGSALTSIGNYAFQGCSNIEEVILPDGLISIGKCAFEKCNLTNVTVPESVIIIGNHAFDCENIQYTQYEGVSYLGSQNNSYYALISAPFSQYSNYVIHADTKVIANEAFFTSRNVGNNIPDGVISIGEYAFAGTLVTSVTIPKSVIYIGSGAFSGQVTNVVFKDTMGWMRRKSLEADSAWEAVSESNLKNSSQAAKTLGETYKYNGSDCCYEFKKV